MTESTATPIKIGTPWPIPDLVEVLGDAEIERAFDLNDQLRNVDTIFDRVFNRTTELAGASGTVGKRAYQS